MGDESNSEIARIDSLVEGARVRLVGAIRRTAAPPLESRLGHVVCVYWDVRDSLDASPIERDSQSFWLEDGTGRVLVDGASLHVDARAERRAALLAAVESDIHVVSARLRDIKDKLAGVSGTESRALHRERERLATLATLLCSVKAHARGRVHGGKGSLESQERWIREHARLTEGETGAAATKLLVDRWEITLAEGQSVEVEGVVSIQPSPPELGQGTNYRESATIRMLTSPDSRGVQVRGIGEYAGAPQRESEAREIELDRRRSARATPLAVIAVSVALIVVIVTCLFR